MISNNYKLYFHQLPTMERKCMELGINVETFLCSGISHMVVLDKQKMCPKLLAKASTLGLKVVSVDAVKKWLAEYMKVSPPHRRNPKHNSPPRPKRVVITQKPELVISDADKKYKPIFMKDTSIKYYPNYPCTGSPFGKASYKDSSDNNHKSKPTNRTTAHAANRKIFCENCHVTVTDLDEHLATLQHRKYARTNANFAELDEVIGDMTLGNLLSSSFKRRRIM